MITIYLKGEVSRYTLDPTTLSVYGSRGLVKPIEWGSRGYLMYSFNHKNTKVRVLTHRLIAEYMIRGLKEGDTVNHIDGDKHNNSVGNLEIVSSDENIQHAFDTRLSKGKAFRKIRATRGTEVIEFRSLNQCRKQLGLNPGNIHSALKKNHSLCGWKLEEI